MNNKTLKLAIKESDEGKDLTDKELKKITNLYISRIKVPKKKNKTQLLICPVGLVDAGKSTVLKLIAKKISFINVSPDEIRGILCQKGHNYLRAVEIAKSVTLKFINLGYSVAADGDGIQPEIQAHLNNLAREKKLEIIWLHIKPTEKFIINKLINYNHTWLFKDADDAISNYKRRKPLHKKYLSCINFYYKFDTSKNNLKEQVDKFTMKLKSDFKI